MDRESPIVEFITDRLDEAERDARDCLEEVGRTRAGEPYEDGSGIADRNDYPSYPWGVGENELAHMVRTHPAAILRDVEVKRKLLNAHLDYYGSGDDSGYPIPTLSLLAALWPDHHEYADLMAEGARDV